MENIFQLLHFKVANGFISHATEHGRKSWRSLFTLLPFGWIKARKTSKVGKQRESSPGHIAQSQDDCDRTGVHLCYVMFPIGERWVAVRPSIHPSVDEERPTTFLTHSAARISRSSARAGILARSAHSAHAVIHSEWRRSHELLAENQGGIP
jgi:hypothetical protein